MDLATVLMVTGDVDAMAVEAALGTGVVFNLTHAAATVFFLAIAGQPLLIKLDKVKIKYGVGDADVSGG